MQNKTYLWKTWFIACLFASTWAFAQEADADRGQELFLSKCAACHTATKDKLTGPGLQGINEKRERQWLQSWIRNSQAMIAAGDPDALAIYNEYNQVTMNAFPELKDEDIDDILAYIKRGPSKPAEAQIAQASAIHGHAEAQREEWVATSTGSNPETLIPLIVLPLFLLVVGFATVKIPGMKD